MNDNDSKELNDIFLRAKAPMTSDGTRDKYFEWADAHKAIFEGLKQAYDLGFKAGSDNGAQRDGDIPRAEDRILVVRGAKVSVDKLSFPVSVRVDLALDGDESLAVVIPAPLHSSWAHLAENICLGCGDLWDRCGCGHCVSCDATRPCCEQCECCCECCECDHFESGEDK